jgi:hypothetical protein
MSTIADGDDLRVVAGVDTHKDVHVAVVLDEVGRLGDTASLAATARGYRNLTGWVTQRADRRPSRPARGFLVEAVSDQST